MRDWRAYVRDRLPPLDIHPEREAEIVDELALQLEAAYDAARASGLTDDAAADEAAREVPDWAVLARRLLEIERPAAARVPPSLRPSAAPPALGSASGGLMTGVAQDIRYALRAMGRAPAFTAAAIVTLALGIAATTVVFSLVDGILLRPLPVEDPDRVVFARETDKSGEDLSLSWPNFLDWRTRARSFTDLAAWRGVTVNLTGIGAPRRVMARQVTANLFDVLGVQPAIGRGFTAEDDRPEAERTALVSYGFWQRELGGRDDVIGHRLTLDDAPATIVGVLPRDFTIARQEDIFLPLGQFITPGHFMWFRGNHFGLAALGRLKEGVTLEDARAELDVLAAQLAAEYPDTNTGQGAMTLTLLEVLVRQVRPALAVLLAAVGAMLLIACVNIANLMLVRGTARAQELAMRRALGARSVRIVRQLLTESLLLAGAGGVAGIALAYIGFESFVALLPDGQPRVHQIGLDGRVLLVASAVSLLTGFVFGVLPAWQAVRGRSMELLRSGRVSGAGQGRATVRRVLLVSELALAVVLLVAAGLMARTMSNLLAIDPGFESRGLITARVSLPSARYKEDDRRLFHQRVVERVGALPGVTSAATSLSLPVEGSNWNSVFIVGGQPVPARADLSSSAFSPVSPEYFATMGIARLRGRGFEAADTEGAPLVAVVNETFARRFWPDGDAVGQRVKQGWPESENPWFEIVGVVRDVKADSLDDPAPLQVYVPMAQDPVSFAAVIARTSADPGLLRRSLEAAVHEVDPVLPVFDMRTMDEVIGRGVGQQRLVMVLLVGFGLLALVMAAVGVFGVASYTVAGRTHELGVRMALGADRGRVLRLVLGQELSLSMVGIALGVAGALAAAGLLRTLLFGVPARDPFTVAGVAVLLLGVTAVACYLPARRATKVDPVTALRCD